MGGERGYVCDQTVNDWRAKLADLCKDYRPENIFNMDECGLFSHDTSRKTVFVKGMIVEVERDLKRAFVPQ